MKHFRVRLVCLALTAFGSAAQAATVCEYRLNPGSSKIETKRSLFSPKFGEAIVYKAGSGKSYTVVKKGKKFVSGEVFVGDTAITRAVVDGQEDLNTYLVKIQSKRYAMDEYFKSGELLEESIHESILGFDEKTKTHFAMIPGPDGKLVRQTTFPEPSLTTIAPNSMALDKDGFVRITFKKPPFISLPGTADYVGDTYQIAYLSNGQDTDSGIVLIKPGLGHIYLQYKDNEGLTRRTWFHKKPSWELVSYLE